MLACPFAYSVSITVLISSLNLVAEIAVVSPWPTSAAYSDEFHSNVITGSTAVVAYAVGKSVTLGLSENVILASIAYSVLGYNPFNVISPPEVTRSGISELAQ